MKRYNFDLNMDLNGHTSHAKILKRITKGKKVLEIGVARGQISRYLSQEMNCQVTGIDISLEFLNEARPYLQDAICINIDNIDQLDESLQENYFDFVILGDVLEHCYNPMGVLKVLYNKIKNDGKIIISIPNIAHNVILMQLLRDQYIYQEEGILDYTHIRNYTRSSFAVCLKRLGYKIIDIDYTYTVPEHLENSIKYEDQSVLVREILINHMNGHVFQNLYVISKNDSDIDISGAIENVSQENYDEISIKIDKEYKKYFINENYKEISFKLETDIHKLYIKPSIRLRKYLLSIYVNKKLLIKGCKDVINNNYSMGDGSNIHIIKGDFKQGDDIDIFIKYINIDTDEIVEDVLKIEDRKREKVRDNISSEIKIIQDKIIDSNVVSFDIFDTLLLRNVLEPTDIFKVVEREYFIRRNKSINFYAERIKAEERARVKSSKEDITIDEIYNEVRCEDIDYLKELEIEIEKKFLIANKHIKPCYELARQLGKRILIISDMYLPSAILEDILISNEYEGYEKLYVSCDVNKTKATGSIYDYVRKTSNIKKDDKWIHIGDNSISDVENANKSQVEGIYYQRLNTRGKKVYPVKTLGDSIISAIQINMQYEPKDTGYWEMFGRDIVAPIYIGFTKWLADLMENKDNVYFLARDGYIPYVLYEKIREKNKRLPQGQYIYASRRGYQYPHLLKMNKNEAIAILTAFNSALGQELTLGEILKNIGLECDKYKNEIKKFHIKGFDEVIVEGEMLHSCRKFLCYIWDDIEQVLSEESKVLEAYFKEIGMYNYNKINVVDIGWRGSTQLAIKDILDKEVEGYYFGTLENMYADIMSKSYGYAFDLGVPFENRSFILDNVMMYELIFSAPQKSLIKFRYNEAGEIIPVLKNVEKNEKLYVLIQQFQKGAIEVFDNCLNYLEYLDISREFALSKMKEFIVNKDITDLIEFTRISNSVGFGNSDDIKNYVSIVTLEEYNTNREHIIQKSQKNLWKGAIIVEDDKKRRFSSLEIEANMHTNKSTLIQKNNPYKDIFNYRNFKSAIKHPKKALSIVFRMMRNKLKLKNI